MNFLVADTSNMPPWLAYLILSILIGVVLFLIVHSIVGFLKGRLKLHLKETRLVEGSSLKGELSLLAKKTIRANELRVSLICKEEIRERVGERRRRSRIELFKEEKILAGSQQYPAGFNKSFEFEFSIPTATDIEKAKAGGMGNVFLGTADLLMGRYRRLKWWVEAELDAEGVNLLDSKRVYIKLGN